MRGFIVDKSVARFKNDENVSELTELDKKNTRLFFEVCDKEWIEWLEKVFWYMFNTSITYSKRYKEMQQLFK